MTSFVLDAYLAMSWLLADAKEADRAYSASVLDAMEQPSTRAAVPVTWALEVSNVIARAEARGVLSEAQSEAFLEMLANVPITADESTFSQALTNTLHLARRYSLSSYDASYLELALRTGLPIASLDTELVRAARKAGVKRFTA